LEAYAQRDPLVQYKNRAFALFQELLSNMRLGVITRMFTFRPRDISSVQMALNRTDGGNEQEQVVEGGLSIDGAQDSEASTDGLENDEPAEAAVSNSNSTVEGKEPPEEASADAKRRRRRRH
jgi:preprotein translocase subunit SecA